MFSLRGKALPILMVALVWVTFSSLLFAQYVRWDDNVLVYENELLKAPFWDFIRESFSCFYHGDYLPLTLLSYWTEVQLFGFNPQAQHFTNLLLHSVNVWLLYRILVQFRFERTLCYGVVLLFALHPVQVESVAWISERKGLLSTFFLFLAILFYQKGARVGVALCYLLSLLAKFTGVLLPFLLVISDFLWSEVRVRRSVLRYLPLFAIGLFASCIRVIAYQQSVSRFNEVLFNGERLFHLPELILTAVSLYLKNFVFPTHLSAIYPDFQPSVSSRLTVLVVGIGVGLLIYQWGRSKNPLYPFFGSFAFLFLIPVLQFVPRINFMNDRYLYLPMIGFSGLLLAFLREFLLGARPRLARWVWGGLSLWGVFLVGITLERCWVWKNSENLWRDTIAKNPQSAIAHNNLGLEYLEGGKETRAIEEFEKALVLGKDNGMAELAYNNLGNIYLSSRNPSVFDLNKAEFYYKRGIEESIRKEDAYVSRLNLAIVYRGQHRYEDAVQLLTSLEADIRASLQDVKYLSLLKKTQELKEAFLNLKLKPRCNSNKDENPWGSRR